MRRLGVVGFSFSDVSEFFSNMDAVEEIAGLHAVVHSVAAEIGEDARGTASTIKYSSRDYLRTGSVDVGVIDAPALLENWSSIEFKIINDMFDRMYPFYRPDGFVKSYELLKIIQSAKSFVDGVDSVISREYPHFPFEYAVLIFCKIYSKKHLSFNYCEYIGRHRISPYGCLTNVVPRQPVMESSKQAYHSEAAIERLEKRLEGADGGLDILSNTFRNVSRLRALCEASVLALGILGKAVLGLSASMFLPVPNASIRTIGSRLSTAHKAKTIFRLMLATEILRCGYWLRTRRFNEGAITEPKVIFFANYQPEGTTIPGAGGNHDTAALVVSAVTQLKSRGIKVLFKEHPATFNQSRRGRVYRGASTRSLALYDYLTRAGVTLVPPDVDSISLMKRCQGVITMSGTAALEGALLGRPVYSPGLTWFSPLLDDMGMPKSIEELGVMVIAKAPLSIDAEGVRGFVSSVVRDTYKRPAIKHLYSALVDGS